MELTSSIRFQRSSNKNIPFACGRHVVSGGKSQIFDSLAKSLVNVNSYFMPCSKMKVDSIAFLSLN